VSAKLHIIQLWRAGTGTQGEREAANEESKHPRAPLTSGPLCGIVQRSAFSAFSVQRSTFKEGTGFIAVFTDALLAMNSFRVDASDFSEPSSCRWTCLVVRFNSSAAN
jgi:hypothetical protein